MCHFSVFLESPEFLGQFLQTYIFKDAVRIIWDSCRFLFLVNVPDNSPFPFPDLFQPLLPCSESRGRVQNFRSLWLLAGCEWGATLAVDQKLWAMTLRIYSQVNPDLANKGCSCLLWRTQPPLGSHRLQLKHLPQCLVTALSDAGSWKYYQNNLLIKQSWAFCLSQRDRSPPWQGPSDDLQEGEQSQDVCEVLKVRCKADFSTRGLVRIGQSSWYNSLGLVDARRGFPGELKNKQSLHKCGWSTCYLEEGIFTQGGIS